MPRTNARDLVGLRFGRLTVEAETDKRSSNGTIIWDCVCLCGRRCQVATHNLTREEPNTQSCGCLQVDRSADPNYPV